MCRQHSLMREGLPNRTIYDSSHTKHLVPSKSSQAGASRRQVSPHLQFVVVINIYSLGSQLFSFSVIPNWQRRQNIASVFSQLPFSVLKNFILVKRCQNKMPRGPFYDWTIRFQCQGYLAAIDILWFLFILNAYTARLYWDYAFCQDARRQWMKRPVWGFTYSMIPFESTEACGPVIKR